MTSDEIALVREGLQLADDAMARLMEVDNQHIAHLAKLLHSVIDFGELIIGVV